ncbi:MAG: hypothetical protein ACRDKI_00665 [Solirubrobacterales bacterium]
MSSMFYEALGRATWWRAKRHAKARLQVNTVRAGVVGAVAVGVIAVGAVLARSHAPTE